MYPTVLVHLFIYIYMHLWYVSMFPYSCFLLTLLKVIYFPFTNYLYKDADVDWILISISLSDGSIRMSSVCLSVSCPFLNWSCLTCLPAFLVLVSYFNEYSLWMVVTVSGHAQLLNENSSIVCWYSDILNQFWLHNIFVLHIN